MTSVFTTREFRFPYTQYKFPGQASDEALLFITREAPVVLWLRLLGVSLVSVVLIIVGLVGSSYATAIDPGLPILVFGLCLAIALLFLFVGYWWIKQLWQKSVFILTNQRLTKFIYTTPWNRYNLSLSLDKVVDTGAYARGYWQAWLGVGTFTARSSAGNRAEKYFFIENVHAFEDLASYVNKLLLAANKHADKINLFRPFIPSFKGEQRKEFMKKYPEYWS